ncbi:LysE family translocator [bacterium]|nr:LysE family translocator [bacterium]
MNNILSFVLASIILAIIPGPDILFVITQAVINGKKSAIMTATGLASGCIFHTTLAAFGVSVIFQQSKTAFWCLKIAGTLYLLYLAYSALKSDKKLIINMENKAVAGFKKGILMNILNPKVIIFFLAFLPQFISEKTKHFVFDMIYLGIIFAFVSWTVFVFCSILASKFHRIINENPNSNKFVNKFAATSYILISIWLICD